MNRAHVERPVYSGAPWPPYSLPPAHGFCPSCCHPRAKCCCCRECRKEAKELLVQPDRQRGDQDLGKLEHAESQLAALHLNMASPFFSTRMHGFATPGTDQPAETASSPVMELKSTSLAQVQPLQRWGIGTAFIGGGCCVHLSIEYSPSSPTATSAVGVLVQGSDDTSLAWLKVEQPGAGYQVKEGIIATHPGANLSVIVFNMTARVRWCEIFSC